LKELYIKKKTSSLVSLKFPIAKLLTVKIVLDIYSILSVNENYSAFIELESSLKYKLTLLVFNNASVSAETSNYDKFISF
jgi:hypothetical protein